MTKNSNGHIHDLQVFSRAALEKRVDDHGFKNIARLELFLWDLELFLQIQAVFGDRIVLKGGAAVQFYLPIAAQRTSVDIDMIFAGTKEEIEEALELITQNLKGNEIFFQFRPHIPQMPKTNLPLHTYYVNVPTVLNDNELRSLRRKEEHEEAHQELKIEFIVNYADIDISKVRGDQIFAVASPFYYNILPINYLFADKLSTLGPSTIGIQDNRLDEQVKQFYDIWMLMKYNFSTINLETVREKYLNRARQECDSRNIEFDFNQINSDVMAQLKRYAEVDTGEDVELKQYISNFKSLYLNANVEFSGAAIACAAEQLKLLFVEIVSGSCDMKIIEKSLKLQNDISLKHLTGISKGAKNNELRNILIDSFGEYSSIPLKVLKGKNPVRIFWSVVNRENIDEIEKLVFDCLSNELIGS